MNWVIDPPGRNILPVIGTEAVFPVGNVFCVGRNYADHAVEMGGDPDREPPFFFIKPSFSVLSPGHEMIYPDHPDDVHHEVEMVVALGTGGRNVRVQDAMQLVFGHAVGVDMTRRDRQAEAKEQRRPWEAGKSFVHAAPCSMITPIELTGAIETAGVSLSINGDVRQSGDVNQMIWKIPEIISRLSELFVLEAGDLIFTGTPAGVGPVKTGDELLANIDGLSELAFRISERRAS